MPFDDVIQHLDSTRVVAIITRRSDGSPVATPTWSMVIDGVPYLRSASGPGSWWYRHALAAGGARFAMGDGALAERDRDAALKLPSEALRLEPVPADDPLQSAIDEAIRAKYSSEPASVAMMLTDAAVGRTLRVLAPAASDSRGRP